VLRHFPELAKQIATVNRKKCLKMKNGEQQNYATLAGHSQAF